MLGGSTPEALLQSQKARLGGIKVSSPHEPGGNTPVVLTHCSDSAWMRAFMLTSPNLFLMDPLSPMVEYKRAAITKIEVVLIVVCVLIYLLFD